MDTERMINELNSVYEKHKNDFVPTFQINIAAMCVDIIPKLKELKNYEDLEEQGLLLRLPCKVGTKVYCIMTNIKGTNPMIFTQNFDYSMIECFDKIVFLTKAEAEEALKGMEMEE